MSDRADRCPLIMTRLGPSGSGGGMIEDECIPLPPRISYNLEKDSPVILPPCNLVQPRRPQPQVTTPPT
ncbi:hypothetical protein PCASD_06594 [Puccinia coronata f. sp. avenae]|uniref:Uncharacterized protein n=1 Tax=Puccinia coronata f. sp. avenae TaxID=200324 RepID=A0A2N5UTA2_9BASI|nr:hypothetical protein PCASD_06594 [Puccinia coronata f. sp. avenae]